MRATILDSPVFTGASKTIYKSIEGSLFAAALIHKGRCSPGRSEALGLLAADAPECDCKRQGL
jgi:hypothetical protein